MSSQMTGVLLMAYGAANSLDEIEAYLADIRGGRPSSPELVQEVKSRYQQMGGRSPLLEITRLQGAALETQLNQTGAMKDPPTFKVYIGMRHWHPYIKEAVTSINEDGVRKVIGLCLTPYYSKLSVGAYSKKLQEAQSAIGRPLNITLVESWNNHPLFIEAVVEKVKKVLEQFEPEVRLQIPILFSAHSLPERILKEQDPYPQQLNETIEAVVKQVGPHPWYFAYQSRGRTPEPWLGPDASELIDQLFGDGHRRMVMVPIGFISDHMETLYDVDIMYRRQAESIGMKLYRAESLNASPSLIKALAAIIREHL